MRVQRVSPIPGARPSRAEYTILGCNRDGQFIAEQPHSHKADDDINTWRKQTSLTSDSAIDVTFNNILLPMVPGKNKVSFSAYAFNSDKVKSQTKTVIYEYKQNNVSLKPRAFVITMGVSVAENSMNLATPANDARMMSQVMTRSLAQLYDNMISLNLISTNDEFSPTEILATKENLQYIFSSLAGEKLLAPANFPSDQAKLLSAAGPARPGDMVFFFFSGHGFADDDGTYFIVPNNTSRCQGMRNADVSAFLSGKATPKKDVVMNYIGRCISSVEMTEWIRNIDAKDIILIMDTCYSGAVVGNNQTFRPGPLGDRGFGQLLYDKGAITLTASTDREQSLGNIDSSYGLLTSALVTDDKIKLADGGVDILAWLERTKLQVTNQSAGSKNGSIQTPELFDFSKKITWSYAK